MKTNVMSSRDQSAGDFGKKVFVILENCYLETAKIKDSYRLLSGDEHHVFLKKNGRDPEYYRPDIVHQCLMTLLDSPLSKSNHLEVILRTHNNILIKVSPQCRIPRTYKRFCGLMIQLLHKLKIKAADSSNNLILMKVVKNPITQHIPMNAKRILCTQYAQQTVQMSDFVRTFMDKTDSSDSSEQKPEQVVFIVGGFAHVEQPLEERVQDYGVHQSICVSNFPLSASVVCSKITNAFEEYWSIL